MRLEARIPPLVLLALAGLLTWVLGLLEIDRVLDGAAGAALGIALVVGGVVIVATGAWAFRMAGTTVDPTAIDQASVLVTAGIYRFTRNPMYVGMVLVLAGWGSTIGSVVALVVGVIVFVAVLTRLQIVPEERMMADTFGDSYITYRRRVRRWI